MSALTKQIEKLERDRTYLRSVIETLLAVARDVPDQIKPAIQEQLEKALDYTKDAE